MLPFFAFLCLVSLSVAKTPSCPELPETFTTWIQATAVDNDNDTITSYSIAEYAVNEKDKKIFENITIEIYGRNGRNASDLIFTSLSLYEKKELYIIQWSEDISYGECQKDKQNVPYPKIWDWVKDAKYTGRYEFLGIDTWSIEVNNATTAVGVSAANSKLPIFMLYDDEDYSEDIYFIGFTSNSPPDSTFDVPSVCSNTQRKSSFVKYVSPRKSFLNKRHIMNMNTITGNYEDSIHPKIHKMIDRAMQRRK